MFAISQGTLCAVDRSHAKSTAPRPIAAS